MIPQALDVFTRARVHLDDRALNTSVTISTMNTSSPIQVTTSLPHGFNTGQWITITGVTGQTGANGNWFITVIDASNFTLNGSVSVGSYTPGSGTITYAGEVFTDSFLQEYLKISYEELFNVFLQDGLPRPKNQAYYTLPAYTNVLSPAQVGITDFGELVSDGLQERQAPTAVAVSTCNTASPIQVTTTVPHGLATNAEVQVWGVVGQTGANGDFFITVIDGSNFTLNGSTSVAAYVSGGTVSTDTDEFTTVEECEDLPQRQPTDKLALFEWRGDQFRFVGATLAVQLQLTYWASGNTPLTGSIGIDNAQNFLAARTAQFAAKSRDNQIWQMLKGDADDFLFKLTNPMQKAMQHTPSQRPRFRMRRTGLNWWGIPW